MISGKAGTESHTQNPIKPTQSDIIFWTITPDNEADADTTALLLAGEVIEKLISCDRSYGGG